jgi:OOP family OmpA-OmpF porin
VVAKADVAPAVVADTHSDINAATAPAPVEAKSAAPDVANIAIVQHYREHPVLVSGFDANAAHLSAATQASLAEVAKAALLANTDRIEINGHTDHVGRATFNLKLSQKRANAAKTYLVKQGVAADRITAVGYGYSKPIASNATEQGRSLNRRIDVKLIQK